MIGLGLDGYDPDSGHEAAAAFRIQVVADEQYIPRHQHRKGQLILALHGALTCEVENAMWMVPPQYAVWVPGQVPHSNRATPEAQVCFLFIEPHAAPMPDFCCTLKISPLVRELILVMAERGRAELAKPAMNRLVQVLFDELPQQPQEHLQLPVSGHPKIRQMVDMMAVDPARWQTLAQWAAEFAMSERNLARLVVRETGLSFRRWRHQLQLILSLQMLIRGQTVQQTAQSLGYDSTTAFITMFKKGLGQTPGRSVPAWLRLPNKQRNDPGGDQRADRDAAEEGDAEHGADQQSGYQLRLRAHQRHAAPAEPGNKNPHGNRQQRFPVHEGVQQRRGR